MTEQVVGSRYRLDELLARGGMGEVWRARDDVLGRPVAVKLMQESLATDPTASERFRREALTAAALSHPNLANVYDYIEEGGRPGIVMELVDGENLASRLAREGPLPAEEASRIAAAVLAALAEAHARSIVHRDVKPANILITRDGKVKLTDLGIARAAGQASLTLTGTVMGTAHYSAPEQVSGGAATPQTDLYSLGVVLYEMLTGRRPFTGETPVAIAMARLAEEPPPPRSIRSEIPPGLEAIVMRALAREPADRHPSARAMLADLISAGDGTMPMPQAPDDPTLRIAPVPPPPRKRRLAPAWLRTLASPRFAAAAAAVAAAILLAVLLVPAGTSTIEVPGFTGMPVAEARALAAEHGIAIDEEEIESGRAAGTVIRQSIPEGTSIVLADTTVVLSVSTGTPRCCLVPDLTGMTLEEARAALADADLVAGNVISRTTTEVSAGQVVDQNPRAGVRVESGDRVDVTIARAPAPPDDDDDDDDDDKKRGQGRGRGGG